MTITEEIGRAFEQARREPLIAPTARLFLLRRKTGAHGWEAIATLVSSAHSERSSVNAEVIYGWLPRAAGGIAPFFVRIALLDPLERAHMEAVGAFGYMPDDSYSSAIVYDTSGFQRAVPTLAGQNVFDFTAGYTKDRFTPRTLTPGLPLHLPGALGYGA